MSKTTKHDTNIRDCFVVVRGAASFGPGVHNFDGTQFVSYRRGWKAHWQMLKTYIRWMRGRR